MQFHMEKHGRILPGTPSLRQIVELGLGGQSFGMNIASVRGSVSRQPTIAIRRSERSMMGLINLRGTVVPMVDLQARLRSDGNAVSGSGVMAAIVESTIGLLSDPVVNIADVLPVDLQPVPRTASTGSPLQGLAVKEEHIVGLIDLTHGATIEGDQL